MAAARHAASTASVVLALAFAVMGGIGFSAEPASAGGGMITIENQSAHAVKVAIPGGSARVFAPAAPPAVVPIDADDEAVGTTLRLWWVSDPLQLCQIVTPWDRTVTITGSHEIRCLSR